MAGATLRFWSATFDMAREPLVYPNKLREVFVKLRSKGDLVLKLPGFEVNYDGDAGRCPTVCCMHVRNC